MAKTDRTVVRNQSYQKGGIGIRERHNERKNESYSNPDIEIERSHMNVHFKKCEGTYTQALDRMIAEGTVSTRGLKADAKVFGEMVFDVNTAYFDNNGGYDYAKHFFEDAFRFAEKEVGSQYILSAIIHADEKNRVLSEELGRDVYHYHLHVVYLPIVEKEVKWTKKCKDKALVGTVKEVINQISHSKKWAFTPIFDENGKPVLTQSGNQKRIPSYSLLQDRFFEHMRDAGYTGFERGVRGSTDEHLPVIDFKIKQDTERLNAIGEKITEQKSVLEEVEQEIKAVKPVKAAFDEISAIGRKKRFSDKVEMSADEYEKLQNLAKEGLTAQMTIAAQNRRMFEQKQRIWALQEELDNLYAKTKDFLTAQKLAPNRVKECFADIFKQRKEAVEQRKSQWRVTVSGKDAR